MYLYNSENILIKDTLYAAYVKAPLILLLEIHSTAFLKHLPDLKHSIQLIKVSANELIIDSDMLDKRAT